MKKINYIHHISVFFLGIFLFSSCDSLLNSDPKSLLIREDFWQSEEDVEASMNGVYNQLQNTLLYSVVWGESRAGYLDYASSTNASITAFNKHEVNAINSYTAWGGFYKVINYVNTIMKFAPDVVNVDTQYDDLNNHMGEAYFLRAFMHFQLIRNFYEIPYLTESYDNDAQEFYVSLTSRDSVFVNIVSDLKKAEELLDPQFTQVYNRKGRASRNAIYATLADTYLWMGEYEKAVAACDKVVGLDLVGKEEWFELFHEGNNEIESIFELQFSNDFKDYQPNSVWSNIFKKTKLTTENNVLWPMLDSSSDYRMGATAVKSGDSNTSPVMMWKYIGTVYEGDYAEDDRIYREANWIYYRYADIVLMRAEALNNLNRGDEALVELNKIRSRAGVSQYDITAPGGQELDELILDERGREFSFEGKRWYDLVRFALRYGDIDDPNADGNTILTERIMEQKASDGLLGFLYYYKIENPYSWFLPINYSELAANPMLRQFEYYKTEY